MKKIKLFVGLLISLLCLPFMVNAASGTIKITGSNTVVVGNKVTVTVALNSSTPMVSWQMLLNYDKKYLQLTSTTSESGGVGMAASSPTGIKNKSYTYTFKTLKKGSTKLSVSSYMAVANNDMSEISLSASSKTISIITQEELEASYSKDNFLKSLEVDGFKLSKEFSKEEVEYSVTVPEGTKEVNIKAIANDNKSSVNGDGVHEVSEGINNFSIIVKAENGSERTYKLAINVIDEHPINVIIDNINYTVIKLRDNFTCPDNYINSEVNINEFTIPACFNENINYTLVGLKKEDGEVLPFIYENEKFIKYDEIIGTDIKLIYLDYDKEIKYLTKYDEVIDGINYQVFKFSNDSKFFVLYGLNVLTGNKDLYMYDTVNKSFTLYNSEVIDYLMEMNNLYIYVIIAFSFAIILCLICIIIMSKKHKKRKNKDNKEENILKE